MFDQAAGQSLDFVCTSHPPLLLTPLNLPPPCRLRGFNFAESLLYDPMHTFAGVLKDVLKALTGLGRWGPQVSGSHHHH